MTTILNVAFSHVHITYYTIPSACY